ncbi:hypothetical protein ES703_125895 [subsurface metagenome]
MRTFPNKFRVIGLAGGENSGLLAKQVSEFQPQLVYSALKLDLPGKAEFSSMEEIASHPDVDLVVIATTGKTGLTLNLLGKVLTMSRVCCPIEPVEPRIANLFMVLLIMQRILHSSML